MEQQIRFFVTPEGHRIAYAVFGRGPAILATPPFAEHLEIVWQFPARRALWESLAQHHTVVVYDRWGTGLSDRERTDFSLDADVRVLEGMVEHLKLRRFALFGASGGGPTAITYAARHPRKLSHLILYGTAATRRPSPTWEAMRALMRVDWQLATRTLAESWYREAEPMDIAQVGRLLFESSTAEMTIGLREEPTSMDVSGLLPEIQTPTLVMQRRGDTAFPVEDVRQLAACIPNARYVPVEGISHMHYIGDVQPIIRVMLDFLGTLPSRRASASADVHAKDGGVSHGEATPLDRLSTREAEVLRLLSAGLSNREIGERLVVSIHTVERHTVNIYAKLGARGRTEAVAYAHQHGIAPAAGTPAT